MNLLAIDTSTSLAGVGLLVGAEERMFTRVWRSQHNHGREIMPAVLSVLEEAKLTIKQVSHIAVARGPGGFSAVRVGIATAKGLAAPTGLPLIGLPTHAIQAYAHKNEKKSRVVSLIPIGRSQVSYGEFEPPIDGVLLDFETGICAAHEVGDRFGSSETILCGEGAIDLPSDPPDSALLSIRSPKLLLELSQSVYCMDEPLSRDVSPIYSRPPTITKSRRF